MNTERRKQRSEKPHEAVKLYLDALRKSGLEALALGTEDGDLVAGAGPLDVEWMASIAASARLSTFAWDDRVIHVRRLEVNHVPMYLSSAGGSVQDDAVSSIQRILAM